MWLNLRGYIPFQVMATTFPLKGENHQNSISFIEYQPRVTAEHLLAQQSGRNIYYTSYKTRICKVERDYDFEK